MLNFIKKFILYSFILFLSVLIIGLGFFVGTVIVASKDLPDVELLNSYQPIESTEIYSADGVLLTKLFKEDRTWIPLNNVSDYFKKAIIATEDVRFYKHHGVDIIGILRAVIANLKREKITQGASTITQQLARNLFLTPELSLRRKIKEALLAIQIERRFSKDEILELYINQVYFGAGAYGIEAASNVYFGKHAKDLDLAESALIAGLVQAPSIYSPFSNRLKAIKRQHIVLDRMYAAGFITYAQLQQAKKEELKFKKPRSELESMLYPYFTTYVIKVLSKKYSSDLLYKGGLKIYTTLDTRMQRIAIKGVRHYLDVAKKERYRVHQAALVCVENKTGYIRAMVGGYKFTKSNQFNRAWQALRQPGSSFKIFVYTEAILKGLKPYTIIKDSPVSFPLGNGRVYSPHNADRRFLGPMYLIDGLAYSRNVVAIKVLNRIGVENVIELAHKMGIESKLEPNLSLALGTSVVSPLEMASAVSTLANLGVKVRVTPIKLIKDSNVNIIEDNRVPIKKRVIPRDVAIISVNMFKEVIKRGTGVNANFGRPAAGKTGTTSDFRDAWFVGFTPRYTTAVWFGNDDYKPTDRLYGGDLPAKTWKYFMSRILKGKKVLDFPRPSSDFYYRPPIIKKKNKKKEEKKQDNPDNTSPQVNINLDDNNSNSQNNNAIDNNSNSTSNDNSGFVEHM